MPPLSVSDLTANALALLLRLLGQPRSPDQDPLHRLQPTGQHLLMRSVLRTQAVTDAIKTRSDAVLKALPEWLRLDSHSVHLHSPGAGLVQWVGKAEPKFLTRKSTTAYPLAGALVVDDLAITEDPQQGRNHWRQWLRLANLLQAVPGVALLTQAMLNARETLAVPRPQVARPAVVAADWNQLLDEAEFLERLKPGFVHLGNRGVPAPDEIGAETEEDGDYRAAEARWQQARIVFLSSAQVECSESWKNAGYTVIEERENWWLDVESALKGQPS